MILIYSLEILAYIRLLSKIFERLLKKITFMLTTISLRK